jgi:hypothetical protein
VLYVFATTYTALDKLMKYLGLYREDNAQRPQLPPPTFVIVGVGPE